MIFSPFPERVTGFFIMKKISKKQAVKNRELDKIRKELPRFCEICGRPASDLMHMLPRSEYPEYYTERWNIIAGCRDCHSHFDDDLSFRQKQTRLISIIKSHDEKAANRYFKL